MKEVITNIGEVVVPAIVLFGLVLLAQVLMKQGTDSNKDGILEGSGLVLDSLQDLIKKAFDQSNAFIDWTTP